MAQTQSLQNSKTDILSTKNLNFNGRQITNAADAVNSQDYTTLSQVQSLISSAVPTTQYQTTTININGKIQNGQPGAVLFIGPTGVLAQDSTKFNYSGSRLNVNALSIGSLTISKPVKSDGSKILVSGSISLTADVSGILPVANGGTGLNSLTAFGIMLGNGTGNVAFASPGTAGFVLTSNGATSNPSFTAPASAPVTTVFGRAGSVVAATNDYNFNQLAGSVANGQLPNVGPGAGTKSPVVSLSIDDQGRITAWS